MARTTTQRTKKHFEKLGCLVGHVEKWIEVTKQRHDLFSRFERGDDGELVHDAEGRRIKLAGFDQVVIGCDPFPTLYVQSTTGPNHAAHKKSMVRNPNISRILEAGNGVALVSWTKKGPRGKRKLWTPRVEFLSKDDMEVES